MLTISNNVGIPESEVEISAVRAQGPGGQNVNKVSSAVHLRFDILGSSLPDFYKSRLLKLRDTRISKSGVVVIKAQQYRSQQLNKEAALARLIELIQSVKSTPKQRRNTKPSKAARQKRLDRKTKRGQLKQLRRKIDPDSQI